MACMNQFWQKDSGRHDKEEKEISDRNMPIQDALGKQHAGTRKNLALNVARRIANMNHKEATQLWARANDLLLDKSNCDNADYPINVKSGFIEIIKILKTQTAEPNTSKKISS